jgi:hypothetical protein
VTACLVHVQPRRVAAPGGVQWRVRRRWLARRLTSPLNRRAIWTDGLAQGFESAELDVAGWVVFAALAAVVMLIAVLVFGVELLILAILLAAGVAGRVLLGQPWLIEARPIDAVRAGRQLEWRIIGWQDSSEFIDRVVSDLTAEREPRKARRRDDGVRQSARVFRSQRDIHDSRLVRAG